MIRVTAKVSEEVNRKLSASYTMAQLLTLYTDTESQNAQRCTQTDIRKNRRYYAAKSRSYTACVHGDRLNDLMTAIPILGFSDVPRSVVFQLYNFVRALRGIHVDM